MKPLRRPRREARRRGRRQRRRRGLRRRLRHRSRHGRWRRHSNSGGRYRRRRAQHDRADLLVGEASASSSKTRRRRSDRHRNESAARPRLRRRDPRGAQGSLLIHHLPAVCSQARVYAIVPPRTIEFGSQAMALGAAGILLAPPSGDGAPPRHRRSAASRRAARGRSRHTAPLGACRAWRRRTELVESVARLADEARSRQGSPRPRRGARRSDPGEPASPSTAWKGMRPRIGRASLPVGERRPARRRPAMGGASRGSSA